MQRDYTKRKVIAPTNFVTKIIEISRVLDPCRVAEISQNAITPRVLISENDFPTTSNWHTELNKTNFFVT